MDDLFCRVTLEILEKSSKICYRGAYGPHLMTQKIKPYRPLSKRSKNSKLILIIGEKLDLVSLLRDTFRAQHLGVLTAATGRKGLEIAFRERPDLIILDTLMPEMDGLTVLRRLRKDRYKWGKYVPVIILSNPETMADGTKYADDYLFKADWTLADLVRKIKEKLRVNSVPMISKTHKSRRLPAGT